MDEKKLAEIMQNQYFMEKLSEASTVEEVKGLFREQGMEVTDADVEALRQVIIKSLAKDNKLSDKELGNVAGGISGAECATIGAIIGGGAVILVQTAVIALTIAKPDMVFNKVLGLILGPGKFNF